MSKLDLKFYQELTIIPCTEISPYFIWSKLYKQLHLALADIKNQHGIDTTGVCFPQYRFEKKEDKTFSTLGSKLRVFGASNNDLTRLNLADWLSHLMDYVHIKNIDSVGDKAKKQVVVMRYQYKNKLKQAQLFAKHKNIDLKQSLVHCSTHKKSNENYPFIRLFSEQNQQTYTLAIKQEIVSNHQNGVFNCYGINNSKGIVTVPYW